MALAVQAHDDEAGGAVEHGVAVGEGGGLLARLLVAVAAPLLRVRLIRPSGRIVTDSNLIREEVISVQMSVCLSVYHSVYL